MISSNTMNLRHIEVFHAVYVNGTISAAAKALNVSQPSVSKVLKHAEGRLGFPLFQRIGGRLTPSDEGHILFKEVDDLYRRIGAVNMTAKNLRGGGDGHIRLAVPPALANAAPNKKGAAGAVKVNVVRVFTVVAIATVAGGVIYSTASALAVSAERDEMRKTKAMTIHTTMKTRPSGQNNPNRTPMVVATPLPPWKRSHTG